MERHATRDCVYRLIQCATCLETIRHREYEEHAETKCPQRLVVCGKCEDVVQYAKLAEHDAHPDAVDQPCVSLKTCPHPGCIQVVHKVRCPFGYAAGAGEGDVHRVKP